MTQNQCLLSVILIIGNQRERARWALKSLLAQSLISQMEILVLDCSEPDQPPVPGSEQPGVRVVRLKPGLPAGWVRAEGIRQTSAPYLAFLEEHAWAMPGWAAAILSTLRGPWSAVGPEMNNGNGWVKLNQLIGLMYYPLWSPPAIRGPVTAFPHHNTAYKRETLLHYAAELDRLMFPERLIHDQLIADGYQAYLNPDMKVLHFFESSLKAACSNGFLAERAYEAGWDYFQKRSFGQRLRRLLLLPLLPFVRTARLFNTVARYRPGQLSILWRGLLVVVVIQIACATGAAAGLLAGMGSTPVEFLNWQINVPRAMPPNGPESSG